MNQTRNQLTRLFLCTLLLGVASATAPQAHARVPGTLACHLNLRYTTGTLTDSTPILPGQVALPMREAGGEAILKRTDGVFQYEVKISSNGGTYAVVSSAAGDYMSLDLAASGIRKNSEVIAGSSFGLRLRNPIPYRIPAYPPGTYAQGYITGATLVCSRGE